MTRKQRRNLYSILIAAALFGIGIILKNRASFWLLLASWGITGWAVVRKAAITIFHGGVFDEHFLMTIATVGAFLLGEYEEGAAVMIFFQIGELFESCAVERSRRSIGALMELRPDSAFVCRGDDVEEVEPEDIALGDILLVKPGQRIPVDGVIIEGTANLDTAQITGESIPVAVEPGQSVLSGCINLSGVLKIRAESAYAHSTVAKILELVENASEKKAPTERMITRFASIYTPVVVVSAVALAVLPPLFVGHWSVWIARALSFLVISCPCALVISVPLSFFGGMGAASRQGVIIKGGGVMEQLAKAQIAAFDKTGTLTKGRLQVTNVIAVNGSREEILSFAAGAESMSSHPIARAICASVEKLPTDVIIEQEKPGYGIRASIGGHRVLVGSNRLLEDAGIAIGEEGSGTCVHVAMDASYRGVICIEDSPKDNAAAALSQLKSLGIEKTVLLTGDQPQAAKKIADCFPLDEIYAKLLPQDKVQKMEQLLSQRRKDGTVLYVGDGVNDAPVLTMADVGIAMGGVGSDAAVEAADVVNLNDDLQKLCAALRLSRKTMQIAKQNIVFALAVKLSILLLAVFGAASMWLAVFADVGVSVLAICNAMRTLRGK